MVTSKALPISNESDTISRQDLVYVFAACIFPVHIWSIYNLLKMVPAWIMRFNTWDLLGAVAYTQMFALIESVVVLIPMVLLGLILPGRLFRNKFVALSTMLVFVTSAWFILAHLNEPLIGNWAPSQFLPWIGFYLISLVIGYLLIHRFTRLENAILAFVQRLAVLSFMYLFVDIMSIIIVIVRNI